MNGGDTGRMVRQGRAMRELSAVHQMSHTRLNRSLRPIGLSMTQVTLLTRLINKPDGVSIGHLAQSMEVGQPAVSKIANTLSRRGAVEVIGDPGDGRRRVVRLTDPGSALIVAARAAMHPEATEIFSDLDDTQLDQLCELLAAVRTRLQRPVGD